MCLNDEVVSDIRTTSLARPDFVLKKLFVIRVGGFLLHAFNVLHDEDFNVVPRMTPPVPPTACDEQKICSFAKTRNNMLGN